MPNAGSFTYWYLQVPSLILLAMIGLMVVRLVVVPLGEAGGWPVRAVRALTKPVMTVVGAMTPRMIAPAGVVVCAIIWLVALRVLLVMTGLALGARI